MNHNYETGVVLSDSVNKTCVKRPLAEKSRWRHFPLAIKPRYLENHASQIKSYYGTLWRSHDRSFRIRHEKSPKAPLVEKSRWRHIRLAIKPCYIGNHASQIKSYNGTLSGSQGCSFIIRHEKSFEVPPGLGLAITSYPVGYTTSLSRKPCTVAKSYYWSLTRRWSLFQNPWWRSVCSFPWRGLTMTSFPGWQ